MANYPNSIAVSSAIYNSGGSLSVGTTPSNNLLTSGIQYHSGTFQTISSNYSITIPIDDLTLEENQPETEEMVQDNNEEHLI